MTGVLDAIKARVDILDVAARYGLKVDRHGKALCFIHKEKSPSLSFKSGRFRCFGCQASGDVIDLVSSIRGISILNAARELDAMYSLHLFDDKPNSVEIQRRTQQAQADSEIVRSFEDWEMNACKVWAEYYLILKKWKSECAPKNQDDPPQPHFVEACHNIGYVEHVYDTIFINGTFEDKANFYKTHAKETEDIEQYFREIGSTL